MTAGLPRLRRRRDVPFLSRQELFCPGQCIGPGEEDFYDTNAEV
jgi:hypothetical protein